MNVDDLTTKEWIPVQGSEGPQVVSVALSEEACNRLPSESESLVLSSFDLVSLHLISQQSFLVDDLFVRLEAVDCYERLKPIGLIPMQASGLGLEGIEFLSALPEFIGINKARLKIFSQGRALCANFVIEGALFNCTAQNPFDGVVVGNPIEYSPTYSAEASGCALDAKQELNFYGLVASFLAVLTAIGLIRRPLV